MAEDRLEKLVRRYQKAAEKKDSWGEHWRECYEYAFPQRENVSCEGFCENSGAKKICIFMTVPRPTPLISWLRRCWPN